MKCFLGAIAREASRRDQELLVLLRAAQADLDSFKKVFKALEPPRDSDE